MLKTNDTEDVVIQSKTLPEAIFVIGYPKSGNTWLTRLLADILSCPVGTEIMEGDHREIAIDVNEEILKRNQQSKYIIYKYHLLPKVLTDHINHRIKRAVYIKRDFRDVAISGFFMKDSKHNKYNIEESEVRYSRVIKVTKMGLFRTLRYFRNRWLLWKFINALLIKWGKKNNIGSWSEHIKQWRSFSAAQADLDIVFIKYEALLQDTKTAVQEILTQLGLPRPSEEDIDAAIDRQSFAKKRKDLENLSHDIDIPRGKEFNIKFLRKGISGDWKNFFSPRIAHKVHKVMGKYLLEYGFETNPNWHRRLCSEDEFIPTERVN
jgi:hypothetical protein